MAFVDTYFSLDTKMQNQSAPQPQDDTRMEGDSAKDTPCYDFVEVDPPTVEDLSAVDCECVEDMTNQRDDAKVHEDVTIGEMMDQLKEQGVKSEARGDHWDEETGLFVCGRCGRMWDGNICYLPRNRAIIHSSFVAGNAQCFPCVDDI
jgi:hypothetical protein